MGPRLTREKTLRLLPPAIMFTVFVAAGLLAPSLKTVIDLALPFFGIIGLGYACGVLFDTPPDGLAWLNTFIVWLALPALLFSLVSATPLTQLANASFILCTAGATATAFALGFINGRFINRSTIPEATIQAMAAGYANIGYMGPGLTLALLGPASAAPTALIFVSDTIFLFSVLPIAMAIGQGGGGGLATTRLVVWRIVSHPFNIATAAGVLAAAVDGHPPAALARMIALLSGAAAPCALFALGVTVGLRPIHRIAHELPIILAIKLVGHPLIVLAFLTFVGGFDRVWVVTAVLMASLPPALNVFVMASQYRVYVERASSAILIGTLLSVLTVTSVLWMVSTGAFPAAVFTPR